jgi:hypothetical protein
MTSLSVPVEGIINCDYAATESNGVFYHCFCWEDAEANAIGTTCIVEQQQGQRVVLWSRKMIQASLSNSDNEMPKIVVDGSGVFVIYYVASNASTEELWYAEINVTNLQSSGDWTTGSLYTIHSDKLFDVHQLEGHDDFVLAYKTTTPELTVERRADASSAATWTTTTAVTPTRVLSVYGHSDDDVVLCAYEASSNLTTRRYDASDGLNEASATTFPAGTYEIYKAGFTKIHDAATALVCEAWHDDASSDPSTYRRLYYCQITNSDASRSGNMQSTKWLSMLSRPWSYANANEGGLSTSFDRNIYCYVGFKSKLASPDDWSQKNAFVVDLNAGNWSATAETIQATPMCSMNTGDAFAHYPDQNHIPHVVPVAPSYGPNKKTRVIPALVFTRVVKENRRLVPAEPMVKGFVWYPEDPWIQHRDDFDPTEVKFFDQPFSHTQFQTTEAGKGLFVSGGTPWMYDGHQCAEIGFCWWPEILALTETTDGSGQLAAGETYSYTVIYEWRDSRGQLHRSAPAIPQEIEITGSNNAVAVDVVLLTLTMKVGLHYPDAQGIVAYVYRTENNGTTFYRLGEYDSPLQNDPAASAFDMTWTDVVDDTTLVNGALLPHQLNRGIWTPLPNFQPPNATAVTRWRNRIWLAHGDVLWYSKELLPEAGGTINSVPEFNPSLSFRLDDGGGKVTALQGMDNALVVFKRDRVIVVTGEGATAAGTGASLQQQIVCEGIGCMGARSVLYVPNRGVYFQSEIGYHLLTRQYEPVYLTAGAAIESTLAGMGIVLGAVLREDRHQIQLIGDTTFFSTTNPTTMLTYNYEQDVWTSAELPPAFTDDDDARAVGCTTWRAYPHDNSMVILSQGGAYCVERFDGAATDYEDERESDTVLIPFQVATAWIHTSGIAGFQRIKSILVQVSKPTASGVKVEIAYDTDGTYPETYDARDTHRWNDPAPSLLRVRPRIQKCSAFRVRISDEDETSKTENLSITALAIVVARKRGHRAVPDAHIGS